MKDFKSIIDWPSASGCDRSEDYHDTREQAEAVCMYCKKNGMGGDGKYYPITTHVQKTSEIWVSEKPTKGGYYWYRKNKNNGMTVVLIDATLECDQPFDVGFCENFGYRFHGRQGWYDLKNIDGEWCGPITKPKED